MVTHVRKELSIMKVIVTKFFTNANRTGKSPQKKIGHISEEQLDQTLQAVRKMLEHPGINSVQVHFTKKANS